MLITGGGPLTFDMKQDRNPAVQCMSRVKQPGDSTIHKHISAGLRHCQPICYSIADLNGRTHASVAE